MQFETHVKQKIQRTHDILSLRFERPNGFDFDAGQYMFITLESNSKKLTKHFTISSSPTEQDHLELTKKLTGHEFANALAALNEGDRVQIKAPYGDFTFKGEHDKIALLSGGIGITPLRSIIRYSTDRQLKSKITLFYSNRSVDNIAFKDELDMMERENENLRVIYTITGPDEKWESYRGFINKEMIQKEIPDYKEHIFYISGPKKMVDSMVGLIKEMSVPGNRIKLDYFPGY